MMIVGTIIGIMFAVGVSIFLFMLFRKIENSFASNSRATRERRERNSEKVEETVRFLKEKIKELENEIDCEIKLTFNHRYDYCGNEIRNTMVSLAENDFMVDFMVDHNMRVDFLKYWWTGMKCEIKEKLRDASDD